MSFPRRQTRQIHVGGEAHALGVHAQDRFAAALVGLVDEHLAIETSGPQQRGVEDLGSVRRAHDDDAFARIEAVHFREQLIERLLALFVAAHRTLNTSLAEGIELVDEDDARSLGLRLREQIAHARRADADEHLDEFGSAQ